jgi:threonine/homoserine/homoserine lactone efflux protein
VIGLALAAVAPRATRAVERKAEKCMVRLMGFDLVGGGGRLLVDVTNV